MSSNASAIAGCANPNQVANTDWIFETLICPLTKELPIDPVNATDGQHYERKAFEAYIQNNPGEGLKSPVTGEAMGPASVPARNIKTLIERAVETAPAECLLASKWKAENFFKKALAGDTEAMYVLGDNYQCGYDGFNKDINLTFEWFQKSHEGGDNDATAMLGILLLTHEDLPMSKLDGFDLLKDAAFNGSNYAAYKLALAYEEGYFGLTANKKQAIHWLEKCLVLQDGVLGDSQKEFAQEKLEELRSSV